MAQNKPILKSIKKLTNTKWTAFYNLIFDNNGKIEEYEMTSRNVNHTLNTIGNNKVDAVSILISRKINGKIEYLITKEFRRPINNFVYGVPAGLIDKNESVESAAIREIKEETGITITNENIKKIYPPYYSTPGMTDELSVILEVELNDSSEYGKTEMESTEIINSHWYTKEEFGELLAVTPYKIGTPALYILMNK